MLSLVRDTWRLLTFRLTAADFETFGWRHLSFGLACCWLAGIGRFWATPGLPWHAYLGLGSVLYPWTLALLVTVLVHPLRQWNASPYLSTVTFLALTGPVALVYGPLTQEVLGVEGASRVRAVAMVLVSVWRVALLSWFLIRFARLRWLEAAIVVPLLLSGIVAALRVLNADRAVLNLLRGGSPAGQVGAESSVVLLSLGQLSCLALPVFGLAYLLLLCLARSRR